MRGYPSLTITLPTHRTAPENRQDPLRLKNLVTEATNRLLSEFNKREIEGVLLRLEQLVSSIDFRNTLSGLALFVNQDFGLSVLLPVSIPERVAVDETFATRDLIYALNHSSRYWVLVLSEKPTRLYEGANEILTEVTSDGFPMTHDGPGGSAPLPGGFGVRRSAISDEYHRKFFRQVDSALQPFLQDDPLPLIVVGVDRYLAFFNEVTGHASAIAGSVTGSHDKTTAPELSKLVWPLVQEHLAAKRQEALDQLAKVVNTGKFVSSVGEVWRLAQEGRGETLLVEEDFHYPARLDASSAHLLPADDAAAPDVITDAVDEIIETVLNKQGKVVFVENGKLTDHQRIALTLRF